MDDGPLYTFIVRVLHNCEVFRWWQINLLNTLSYEKSAKLEVLLLELFE
jgi:hypothetical protein